MKIQIYLVQDNCYDNISEVIAYEIAVLLSNGLYFKLKDLLPKQVSFEDQKSIMYPFGTMINNSVDDICHWVV